MFVKFRAYRFAAISDVFGAKPGLMHRSKFGRFGRGRSALGDRMQAVSGRLSISLKTPRPSRLSGLFL